MPDTEYAKATIAALIDGKLGPEREREMMRRAKDPDRFGKYLTVLQERVPWPEPILLRLGVHLYIVLRDDASIVTRCECGYDFGDYRVNWKLNSLIHVRSSREELEEIYPRPRTPLPGWCEIREYYCPECATQLCVEGVPPGYPPVFELLPDLDTLYRDWLREPLDARVQFTDKTYEVLEGWVEDGG
jgi:acetone carboxylase gamma subunit